MVLTRTVWWIIIAILLGIGVFFNSIGLLLLFKKRSLVYTDSVILNLWPLFLAIGTILFLSGSVLTGLLLTNIVGATQDSKSASQGQIKDQGDQQPQGSGNQATQSQQGAQVAPAKESGQVPPVASGALAPSPAPVSAPSPAPAPTTTPATPALLPAANSTPSNPAPIPSRCQTNGAGDVECPTTMQAINQIQGPSKCTISIDNRDNNGNMYITNEKNHVVWSTGPHPNTKGPYHTVLQGDGNYVLYDNDRKPIWSVFGSSPVNRASGAPYSVTMQDDCNFVLMDKVGGPTWHSNTSTKQFQ